MAFPTPIKFIVPLLMTMSVWADDIQLNPSHPSQYTVVQGDTLWDISGRFLQHPSQWPRLWSYNSQIQNPHRIYPGDTLYFSMVDGQPRLSFSQDTLQGQSSYEGTIGLDGDASCVLEDEDITQNRTNYGMATGTLSPCIHVTDIKKAVNLITTDQIDQFLTSPRVVTEAEQKSAPYVVDFAGEHLLAGTGDKLYVRGLPATKQARMAYTIYRPGAAYVRPVTNEILGYEAAYVADAILAQEGNPATLTITKATSEIRIGDRIMPNAEANVSLNYFPRPPDKAITANIIGVLGGVSQIGRYNVVVIDRGRDDGLMPGHELEIFKRGRIARDPYSVVKNDVVKLPDEFAGTLMVFRPFDRVSYALVMKASQAIHILDKAQTP